jgi:hypothetical protein
MPGCKWLRYEKVTDYFMVCARWDEHVKPDDCRVCPDYIECVEEQKEAAR